MSQHTLSRRTVLRRGALVSTTLGLGLAATSGVTAAEKPELVEAIASKSGLSARQVTQALDAFTGATTRALGSGQSATLVGFGSFSISKRSARTGRNPRSKRSTEDSPVAFDPCPEFAAALDLNPGKGDEASAKCRDADVLIDAAYIEIATRGRRGEGLSKADAKRAIDGFVSVAVDALKKGDRLSISAPDDSGDSGDSDDSFGSFSISKRSARTGRNPQTAKEIQIAAKNVVKFKAGAELSGQVN